MLPPAAALVRARFKSILDARRLAMLGLGRLTPPGRSVNGTSGGGIKMRCKVLRKPDGMICSVSGVQTRQKTNAGEIQGVGWDHLMEEVL